jgi:hypothetical protein
VPSTISVYRQDLFSRSFYLENENRLFPFNINIIIDWYLISSINLNMSIISRASTNFINLLNTTTVIESSSSSTIRSMPIFKAIPIAFVLSTIVILCICGNILVILSVFTFRPLRTVQNFFIVSLAFSDMLVAIIVMPFHIVTHILKRWIFGKEKQKFKNKKKFFHIFIFRTNILSSFCHV